MHAGQSMLVKRPPVVQLQSVYPRGANVNRTNVLRDVEGYTSIVITLQHFSRENRRETLGNPDTTQHWEDSQVDYNTILIRNGSRTEMSRIVFKFDF